MDEQAHSAYLYVENTEGPIKGWTKHLPGKHLTNPAVEGGETDIREMILVKMLDQTITRPTANGIAKTSGAANYGTLDCVCNFDESTCGLFKAMLESQELPRVGLYLWHEGQFRLADDGEIDRNELSHNWFTIELREAKLVNMTLAVGETSIVSLSFSYKMIKFINHDNKNAPAIYEW